MPTEPTDEELLYEMTAAVAVEDEPCEEWEVEDAVERFQARLTEGCDIPWDYDLRFRERWRYTT